MPTLKFLTSTHDGQMLRTFLNACEMYFKLTGISDENTKAQFAKTRLSDTACTWYDSQRYDETMAIFTTVRSHMLDYFIPSNYIKRAKTALFAYKMG